jgi:hypothetical protein
MENKVNEYIFKLSGGASIPAPLEMDKSYEVTVHADVTSQSDESNDDGTVDRIFKAKFIRAEIVSDNGTVTRTRDARKRSQQLRAVHRNEWHEQGRNLTEEEYYDIEQSYIIQKRIELGRDEFRRRLEKE